MPPRLLQATRARRRRSSPTGRSCLREAAQVARSIGRAAITPGVPTFGASPSDSNAGIAGLGERARARAIEPVDGRRLRRRGRRAPACAWSAKRAEVAPSSARSSRRKRGRRWMSASRSSRRSAVASRPRWPSCRSQPATASRSRASGASDRVGVDAPAARASLFWRGEDREHLVDLAQRRVGAADDLVEVLAAAGQAGAELVEDDRQPLAVGRAHDVVDQVEVDRLASCLLDRQQVLALARPPLDLLQLRRRLGARRRALRRLALDELLADQRLRADRCTRRRARKSW